MKGEDLVCQEYWVTSPIFFRESDWSGQSSGQWEVRSPRFYFLVCCGCLLPRASLFPSLCLSFFLCNIMLMCPCCIWVLRELGWRDRQGPKLSLLVGSDCLWQWKMFFSCVCLDADAQTSSFMACTWVEDNWGILEVFWVRCSLFFFCMEDWWARGIWDGPKPVGIADIFFSEK